MRTNPMEEGNIKVMCRFRPVRKERINLQVDSTSVEIPNQNKTKVMTFDKIFGPESSQAEIYREGARGIVDSVMEGYNGSILAYGPTCSGKTYTMIGPSIFNSETMGVSPRLVASIFEWIDSAPRYIEFTVKLSFLEIYQEKIRDLLDTSKASLKIFEDKRGISIRNLSEFNVSSESEILSLMKKGIHRREVGCNSINSESSRSHALLVLAVSQFNAFEKTKKTGKLWLVDLAGSESASSSEGIRLEEAKKINKSLTTLGIVIFTLTDGKSTHVPYRDSKLTRVLQDSLGGNSKTLLIITCSSDLNDQKETLRSLRFGVRAKSVKNFAKINYEIHTAELASQLEHVQNQIKDRDKRIEELLEQKNMKIENFILDEVSREFDDLKEKLRIYIIRHLDAREEQKALEFTFKQANKKLQDLDHLTTSQHSLLEEYQRKENQMKEEICNLEITNESIKSEIVQTRKKIEIQEIEEMSKTSLRIDLMEKLQMLEAKNITMHKKIARLVLSSQEQNKARRSEVNFLRQRTLLLDREVKEMREKHLELEKKFSKERNLERSLANLSELYNEMINQKSALSVNNQVVSCKLSKLTSKLELLENKLRVSKDRIEETRQKVRMLEDAS